MEVKDVVFPVKIPEPEKGLQTNSTSDLSTQGQAVSSTSPDVRVTIEAAPADPNSRYRTEINRAIEAVNLAATATGEIAELARSISGFTEQVAAQNLPESRKPVLESEARSLAEEIQKRVQTSTSQGIRPLMGDPIRLEIESIYGQSLDVLLPDNGKDGFGLGQIDYSTKEAILQTQVSIARARERIAKLQEQIDASKRQLSETVSANEVALLNKEAAQSSVRDLDRALAIADGAQLGIRSDPKEAINSLGSLNKSSLRLLEPEL